MLCHKTCMTGVKRQRARNTCAYDIKAHGIVPEKAKIYCVVDLLNQVKMTKHPWHILYFRARCRLTPANIDMSGVNL